MSEHRFANMAQWSQAWLRAHPKRRALGQKTRYRLFALSYAELNRRVQRCRRVFLEEGCRQGDRLILIGPNSPDWVAAFLACIQSGLVAVPLDIHSPPELIATITEQTTPALTLAWRPAMKNVKNLLFSDLAKRLETLPEQEAPLAEIRGQDLLEIIYTSGTTGTPKGVMLTHANVMASLEGMLKIFRPPFPINFLSTLPLSHMLEQTLGLFFPLSQGYAVIYPDTLWPSRLVRIIREQKINAWAAVPGLLRAVKESIERGGQNPRRALGWRLRLIGVGGAALGADLESWWSKQGVRVIQGYGMTEAGPLIAINTIVHKRAGSLGQPLSGVEVRLAQDGEIQARGKNITPGYWEQPEKTTALFTPDGWLKTGDIGELRNGWFFFRGRLKDMIAAESGAKVFPEDIEPKLNAVPGVRDSCVLEYRGKVWAVLLLGQSISTQDAIQAANAGLMPHQKIAGATTWPLPDFPRTPLGKVRKFEISKWLNEIDESAEPAKPAAYANRLEELIGRMAKRAHIDSDAKLADLGMDSLDRMVLLSAIEEELGVDIDERQVTETTTVAELSALVNAGHAPPNEPLGALWQFSWPADVVRLILDWLPQVLINLMTRPRGEGLEHLQGLTAPAIFAANHQSGWDGALVYKFLPRNFKKCAFPSYTDFFGLSGDDTGLKRLALKSMGFAISLFYRAYAFGPAAGTERSFEVTGRLIDKGYSITIFPEGARTPDGKIHEFMGGIAELAREMRLPIVPVRIEGMYEILPYPRYVLPKKFGRTRVIFGAPLRLGIELTPVQAAQEIQKAVEDLA